MAETAKTPAPRYRAARLDAGWAILDDTTGYSVSLGALLDAERTSAKVARRQAAALNARQQ